MREVDNVELYWTWIGQVTAVVCSRETGLSLNLI